MLTCDFVMVVVHAKGRDDEFESRKVLKETIHFLLKTVLCSWNALTNYTTAY